jgi:hypothetical protein
MTPVHVKNKREAEKLQNNLTDSKPQAKKRLKSRQITIHVAPDADPLTIAALATLAKRVMEMGEDELREFLKRVRKA